MGKLLLTGVDGNLGETAAEIFAYFRTERESDLLWL